MQTSISFVPRNPFATAPPVSPDVATKTVIFFELLLSLK